MKYPDDVPELPITKPKQLTNLETLSPEILDAMTEVEATERVEEAAYALACNYRDEVDDDIDGCIRMVSTALKVTGNSLRSRHIGPKLVAESEALAKEACRVVLTENDLEY